MIRVPVFVFSLAALLVLATGPIARAQRQMEHLDRGVVAVRATSTEVFVSWRLLGTEPPDIGFNLYRSTGGGPAVKLNATLLIAGTNYTDAGADLAQTNAYSVQAVLAGLEQDAEAAFTLPANAPVRQYLPVPLQRPASGTTPTGENFSYRANDASVGDLDGDGDYEIVLKWDPSNSKDNSQDGVTGEVYLDAYRLDGTRLWRINLGRNIRAGAHYTQFMVYDLDGDGRAEIACKTADGTIDGVGQVIGDPDADHRDLTPNPVSHRVGHVLRGPEFLTIFDGLTGAARATTDYAPARGNVSDWGDNYGNRVDRFLACVAYLDGERPSLVMCRGYYTRAVLAAWDWRNGQLTPRWVFDSDDGTPGNSSYRGEGNHQLSVADIDADGRDEIIYGGAVIDDDGTGHHATGLHHGDAMHVSDLDPARPGLEVWSCLEDVNNNGGIGLCLRDALTGARLLTVPNNTDTGRAVAIDIDPRHPGYEMWGAAGGLYTTTGNQIAPSRPGSMNFAIWWDGDLLREIHDGSNNDGGSGGSPYIDKWNWTSGTTTRLLSATGAFVNNSTKANPCLSGDLLGDWREELVVRSTDSSELRIYTTTIPTEHRIPTLMHDPQYRLAIAWQNVAYNQPPHPGFYLGDGMTRAPTFDISTAGAPPAGVSHITNLSARTLGGRGAETMILGFVVAGSGQQSLLVRGVGPRLADFEVTGAMANPRLDLYEHETLPGGGARDVWRAGNDDWSSAVNAAQINTTAEAIGTFTLPDPSPDAAMLIDLPGGVFTAHISPATGSPGIALAEIYAVGATGTARLINASARAQVAPGEQTLIAGFVISGDAPKTVLIRAVGPGLDQFGVTNLLANPELTLYRLDANGETWTPIATNADWSWTSGASLATFARLGVFAVPAGSNDAALLLPLSPGVYTAHASGVGGASGVALIELYDADG